MKVCSKCKIEKDLSKFIKDKTVKSGIGTKCKSCAKEYAKKHYKDNIDTYKVYYQDNYEGRFDKVKKYFKDKEDGLHHVYLIPNNGENYVGVTTNIYRRMQHHKHYKRDISNYTILGSFINREDALRLETEYHDKGYAGMHAFSKFVRR